MNPTRRWLFGDQLGRHFLDAADQPVLLVEARAVFRRRRFHRQKAHLILSAMRHRAAELGDQCRYLRTMTYREAVETVGEPLTVCHPTTRPALAFVQSLPNVDVLPARGFATSMADFRRWVDGRGKRRLLMEDFYRDARQRLGILMDGAEPAGGRWNFDRENREPPPPDGQVRVREPYWPAEDDIDAEVRHDLDRWERDGDVAFVGRDGPRRFAVTRREALSALRRFIDGRLPAFGASEDAMLSSDSWMAHSLLSAPMNLGLLDPMEAVTRAERAYRAGRAPLNSVEGYVRQLIGWRDYVWHVYWYADGSYRERNSLGADGRIPDWFAELDADAVTANCLAHVLAELRDHGWVHHIPRLMILGNYGLQRGWSPQQLSDWFHRCFVDGYDWVMTSNVVGMSQHADGGFMATKPYAAGGAYIDRMSDFCAGCRYDPKIRVGDRACPYTAGYWTFLDRNRARLAGNARMQPALRGLDRRTDIGAVTEQELARGAAPP